MILAVEINPFTITLHNAHVLQITIVQIAELQTDVTGVFQENVATKEIVLSQSITANFIAITLQMYVMSVLHLKDVLGVD